MLLWVVALVVLFWIWMCTRRPSWSPNGPFLLPLFGNLLSVNSKHPHRTFELWAKRFGAIFHCRLGAQELIVLNSPNLIREALGKSEITPRPDTALFSFVTGGAGLVASSGERWLESRRLTLHNLRNLGMGKSKLEGFIHTQIQDFMTDSLSKNCGRAIELGSSLNVAIVNIIWRLVASEELGLQGGWAEETMEWMAQSIGFAETLAMLDCFPWLNSVLLKSLFNRDKTEERFKEKARSSFLTSVEQHREEFNLNSEPRDLIDAFLQEQSRRPDLVTDWQIVAAIMDLFFAGNDTTATTLRWAFCLLCEHPEAQRRLQQEVDSVVGRDRVPALSDRVNMPYTEAALLEIQRMAAIAPLGLPHATAAPTKLAGFQLPAGLQVWPNIYYVHYDETLFPDPHQFDPERFIDDSGKFRPDRNVMPFSAGRRQCLGEALARAELFLFVTSLLQNFSFRWPEGFKHGLSEAEELAINRKPAGYKLIPEKR